MGLCRGHYRWWDFHFVLSMEIILLMNFNTVLGSLQCTQCGTVWQYYPHFHFHKFSDMVDMIISCATRRETKIAGSQTFFSSFFERMF